VRSKKIITKIGKAGMVKGMGIRGVGKSRGSPVSKEICKGNIVGLVVPKIRIKW